MTCRDFRKALKCRNDLKNTLFITSNNVKGLTFIKHIKRSSLAVNSAYLYFAIAIINKSNVQIFRLNESLK